MFAATFCNWLAWSDWLAAGIAADIAGAWMLASSFATKRPRELAEEVLVVTRTWARLEQGLEKLASSLARQKAEAQVGMVFLVSGFVMQGVVVFWPHSSHFETNQHRLAAAGIIVVVWLLALVVWTTYVPRKTASEMEATRAAAADIVAADGAA